MSHPKNFTCETCGIAFISTSNRAAKFCPEHRKKRGEPLDPKATDERRNARKRSKRAGAAAVKADDFAELELMAIGLSVYPDSPERAAKRVGIASRDVHRLAELARATCLEIVEGDRSELGRRMISTLMLIDRRLATAVLGDEISPRDLPHAGRALSQIHETIVGKGKQSFGDLHMFLVGADGKPFDPNEAPQPPPPIADPDAPTKH